MKFVLIVVWFALPQQPQPYAGLNTANASFSNVSASQPLGIAMAEFDNERACTAEAARLSNPYIQARCAPKAQ